MRTSLALSLAGNAATAVAAAALVRRRGGLRAVAARWRDRTPTAAFPRAEPGTTVLAGDSHAADAPLLELLTTWRRCGIAGQRVEQVAQWLPQTVGPDVARVVLSAGSNDLLQGVPVPTVLARYAALLDRLPDVPVTVLGVPRLAGHERASDELDRALSRLAAARGLQHQPLVRTPGGDGIHLSRDDYARLLAALGPSAPRPDRAAGPC